MESDEPQWKGYLYTILICIVSVLNTLLQVQYVVNRSKIGLRTDNNYGLHEQAATFYRQYIISLRIRTALTSAIYRKSVRLSNTGRKIMTGELMEGQRKKP